MTAHQDPATIRRILRYARTVAIVGLSSNELRASHFVGFYLQRHGYRVIPVNPRERAVLGEPSYEQLRDLPEPIDVVDVFRHGDAVPDIARAAVDIGARALWLQYGVYSEQGVEIALAAGMDVVVDRCLKIEHARYLGRMHWLGFNTGVLGARR
jgi:predicted CoA-binding protein